LKQYFFDITGTAWHLKRAQHFSGIQRTVVMLIEKTAGLVGPGNVHLCFFDKTRQHYRTFAYSSLAQNELTDADALRSILGFSPIRDRLHPSLRRYRDRPLKLFFHKTVAAANALAGNDRYFKRHNTTAKEWQNYHRTEARSRSVVTPSSFEAVARRGDHLILLDGTFTVSRATDAFRSAREKGLHVHTMIHDLIPITAPKIVPALNQLPFHDWLYNSETWTTEYLANSEATCRDLRYFLEAYEIDRPVTVIRLAQARLPGVARAETGPLFAKVNRKAYPEIVATSLDERLQAITSYPYVLCVGTIESRKNVWRLATAWDRLSQMEGISLPKLVFAGRPGYMKHDLDALLAATGRIRGWVDIIETPSDAELIHLYRNCLFLAMPSLYEGWGLPVGEALSYGKTAVISNTSSLPEVGGDLVEYCDPTSIDSIAEACLRLVTDPAHRESLEARIALTRLRSWDDVAADLVKAITQS